MTPEQIQEQYLHDLEDALSSHDPFLRSCYRKCKLTWPVSNVARFEWPENTALTANTLTFFSTSNVVWASAIANVHNGKLVVEVLLTYA